MIFRPHEQPRGAENAAPDLKVPAIVRVTAQHAGAAEPQPRFELPQALMRRFPTLAPQGRGDWPERGQTHGAVAAPGGEALRETPAQPSDGLEQVQRRRQQSPPEL